MPARHVITRLLAVSITAGVILGLAPAGPAATHEVSGSGATNLRTTLSALSPPAAGVTLRAVENGSRLELTNTTSTDVVVRGYAGEPYARVGPGGVFENTRSAATYLNRDRYGTTRVPAGVDPKAAPQWRKVDGGRVYRGTTTASTGCPNSSHQQ